MNLKLITLAIVLVFLKYYSEKITDFNNSFIQAHTLCIRGAQIRASGRPGI